MNVQVPEIMKTMREMSQEMMKLGIIEEMVEETMESIEPPDLEERAQVGILFLFFISISKHQLSYCCILQVFFTSKISFSITILISLFLTRNNREIFKFVNSWKTNIRFFQEEVDRILWEITAGELGKAPQAVSDNLGDQSSRVANEDFDSMATRLAELKE